MFSFFRTKTLIFFVPLVAKELTPFRRIMLTERLSG